LGAQYYKSVTIIANADNFFSFSKVEKSPMNKTFVSGLIGIALNERFISSIDEPVLRM
jgi:hypothetical protein